MGRRKGFFAPAATAASTWRVTVASCALVVTAATSSGTLSSLTRKTTLSMKSCAIDSST